MLARKTALASLPLLVAAACGGPGLDGAATAAAELAVVGNIHPAAIQIDGPAAAAPGADLLPNVGAPLNAGAAADWIADTAGDSGTGCLGADGIASCIEPNVTGAVGGTGHSNGVRIVDGIAAGDQDIFLNGGKENDATTWNPGPGSVGSSKYDIVQAYLANNQNEIFFGMERRGNNGTTAFDFEFNQQMPMARADCPQLPNVPCRSVGDVLFTFEMQGSGGSGSAAPHIYTFNGTKYVEGSAAGILSSINNSTTTAGGPWGHVDSHGDWVLGNLERFTFAEASAPIALLPGVDGCGGGAYVQVRTRSSSVETSDLKDLTRVFEFRFNSVSARAALTPSCDSAFGYSATGTGNDGNPLVNPSCSWTFSDGSTSDSCSGSLAAAPGTITGTVTVTDPSNAGCAATATSAPVNVYAPIAVSADLTATCESAFGYAALASGGSDPANASYAWSFSGGGSTSPSSSSAASGSVAVGTANVEYGGTVVVTDPRTDITCTASASDSAIPLAPLQVNLALLDGGGVCPTLSSDAVTYLAEPSGGNGDYLLAWVGQACSGDMCTVDPEDSALCDDQTLQVIVGDSSGLCAAAASETERYAKVTTVNATDLP